MNRGCDRCCQVDSTSSVTGSQGPPPGTLIPKPTGDNKGVQKAPARKERPHPGWAPSLPGVGGQSFSSSRAKKCRERSQEAVAIMGSVAFVT